MKGVLNLQTKHDMKYRSIDWKSLEKIYEKMQIKVINFEIIDMDGSDFINKAIEACKLLKELFSSCPVYLNF